MQKMEMLSPAGNREALERAVACGADAVYLGYSAFSARAGAGNFDSEGLRSALDYAHLHHVRVHAAVNTLVKDGELDGVYRVLELLSRLGVDAVLIQDLGVLDIARRCFPDLPVHASTQMAIHNRAGVRFLRGEGVVRAVLARECSLEEIRECAREGTEIEVFCHGAQCVSVSGECLMSSFIGGRSGNRGRCAQPCRLNYTYRGESGAWLSPRDICIRDSLPRFQEAGVASLKIEGRLKRPEYVALVTQSYARGIRSAALGEPSGSTPGEREGLAQIFQRGGFMDGYALGSEDAAVIDPLHVSHRGVPIGRVVKVSPDRHFAEVTLTRPLHDGDQLAFSDRREGEMLYAGKETAAGETARIRLRPGMEARQGGEVRRLTDSAQLKAAQAALPEPIPVRAFLLARVGEPLLLRLIDGTAEASAQGGVVQPARTRALTAADAERSIGKMGDTPFVLEGLEVRTEDAFVSAAEINALRREALEKLSAARIAAFRRSPGRVLPLPECPLPEGEAPSLLIFREPSQIRGYAGGRRLAWSPEDFRDEALERELPGLPRGVWLALPTVCTEADLEGLREYVLRHRDRLGGVVLGSVGQLGLSWPVPFGAGPGVPVMNRRAAAFLFARGCEFVTASPELSGEEVRQLAAGCGRILGYGYGRLQLMLLSHCPARTRLHLTQGHAACSLCDTPSRDALRGTALEDRFHASYPLLRQRLGAGCLVRLMAPRPVTNLERMREAGIRDIMELTDEAGVQDAREAQDEPGHWYSPVE